MSSLAAKIAETFLTCAVCYKPVNKPKALACNHGFCKGCLQSCLEVSPIKDSLKCPSCQHVTPLPMGVEGLPAHFLVSSLKETVQAHEVTSHIKTIPCSTCATRSYKNAKVECLDCKKYLCHCCYIDHNKFIKDHKFITVRDLCSGKLTLSDDEDKAKYCHKHGEKVEYFCKECEKAVCFVCIESNNCPNEHKRTEIEKAGPEFDVILRDLAIACAETKKMCQDAICETNKVNQEFQRNKLIVGKTLAHLKKEYVDMIDRIFQKHAAQIAQIDLERTQEIEDVQINLKSAIVCIDLACKQVETITPYSKSDGASVFKYASLCTTLKKITDYNPEAINRALGFMTFTTSTPPLLTSFGQLNLKEASSPDTSWKLQAHFTTTGLDLPLAVAVCKNGNTVVTCWENSTIVYTRSGEVVNVLQNTSPAVGVFATETNGYVVAHVNDHNITYYDENCVAIRVIPVLSLDESSSPLNSIAMDKKGRIIAATVKNAIAICAPHVVSKFETKMKPFRLAATSDDRIAVTMYSDELQKPVSIELMDYSGRNAKTIQPPFDVLTWQPSFLCCSAQGEVFVSNIGKPSGVYRYSVAGDYLGYVTMDTEHPAGLAMSEDETELFVVDSRSKEVKIFRRY